MNKGKLFIGVLVAMLVMVTMSGCPDPSTEPTKPEGTLVNIEILGVNAGNLVFDTTISRTAPAEKTVTVSNIDKYATGELTVALSDEDAGVFAVSTASIPSIAAGQTANFGVSVNMDLVTESRDYAATVTISGKGIESETFQVKYTNTAADYRITFAQTALPFAAQPLNYSPVTLQTVSFTNTGNLPTGTLTADLAGDDAGSFQITSSTAIGDIAVGQLGSVSVKPKDGLAPGTYTARVTVGNANITGAGFDLRQR